MTDVVMPDGMNGLELAMQVRARFPALPIILTSGYNDVVASEQADFTVLRKPVPYEELHRVVCSVPGECGGGLTNRRKHCLILSN